MASVIHGHEAIVAADEERPVLKAIERLVRCETCSHLRLVDDTGQEVVLPASVRAVLETTAALLARERGVLIAGVRALLTTQEVADLLGVSRPHVVKLLDNGVIPFSQPGTHRRVALQDVLAYQEAIRRGREAGLRRIVEIGEEMEDDAGGS